MTHSAMLPVPTSPQELYTNFLHTSTYAKATFSCQASKTLSSEIKAKLALLN